MSDARIRLRHLDEILRLLYPPAHSPAAAQSARTVLPHRLAPRRVVPRTRWHVALGRPLLVSDGPDTIETYLGEVLGRRVHMVVRVEPAGQADGKPVLEAYDGARLLGFVKIGDTEPARKLVRREAEVLRMLAERPLKTVLPPSVLHQGVWRGLDVLLLSPPPPASRKIPADLFTAAVLEIAALADPGEPPRPGEPAGPEERRRPGEPAGPAESALLPASPAGRPASGDGTADEARPPQATKGSSPGMAGWHWHGDFTPWTTAASSDGRLLVWDWGHFEGGVPFGFDALHHFFHRALRRMRPPQAARACVAQATAILEPFGLSSGEARRVAVHYLVTLADRHYRDGNEPLGPPSEWLNPAVDHLEILP